MKSSLIIRSAGLVLCLCTSVLAADKSDTNWWRGFCPMGVNGPVSAAEEWVSDIIVGGTFTEAGGVEASCVARWNGTYWRAMDDGLNRAPTTLYDWGNGGVLAGGDFWLSGEDTVKFVAQYHEGSWHRMGDNIHSEVFDFCMHGESLWAAGVFPLDPMDPMSPYSAGARWTGVDWAHDYRIGWEGGSDEIYAMEHFNANLYFGGQFIYDNLLQPGVLPEALNVVRLDDEGDFYRLQDGIGGRVTDMVIANETLWLAGPFISADGEACNGLAWVSSAHLLYAADPVPITATIQDLVEYHSRPVAALSGSSEHQVMLYAQGGPWQDNYPGNFLQPLSSVATEGDRLYAGGSFYNGIAVWNDDQWVHLGGGMGNSSGNNSYVRALVKWDEGLVAAGHFVLPGIVEDLYSQNLAYWNGEHWHFMDLVLNFEAAALATYDGDLIAGGSFTTVNGELCQHIVRWDGADWHSLGGMEDGVWAMTSDWDDKLVAGGSFTAAGGVGAPRIAAWNGSYWTAFGAGFNSSVRALHVHDGDLYAGGYFTLSGGTSVNHIARWNPGTVQWEALGAGLDDDVLSLTSYMGDLVAGGRFTTAGGESAACIARWDGSQWHAMGAGMAGDAVQLGVKTLLAAGDRLFAGGNFAQAGGLAVDYVAEWDGAAWTPLGTGVHDGVFQTEVLSMEFLDGDLYLGGHFGTAGTYPSLNMARWEDGTLVAAMLQSLEVLREAGSVRVTWEMSENVTLDCFRVDARTDDQSRPVPLEVAEGVYSALDREASPGQDVEYVLSYRRSADSSWTELARRTVEIPTPGNQRLEGAFPNPFNPSTSVIFTLERAAAVRLNIYALDGRLLARLADEAFGPGRHELPWDGRDDRGRAAASGSYIVRLESDTGAESAKITLVR